MPVCASPPVAAETASIMSAADFERAALAYARLGWAVFPLSGKIPYAGSRGVHDATTNPDTIRRWWRERPGSNVAVVGGPVSGVWFLDSDPRHGGAAALEALCSIHGELPTTPRQDTGGADHGEHYAFAWPTDGRIVGTSAGELPAGLDVRGSSGYVVAAPSVHPDTGRAYVWDEDDHPLKVIPAPAPEWLLSMVATRPTTGRTLPKTPSEWLDIVAAKDAGQGRHEALLTLFGLLVRKLPARLAVELAQCWNHTNLRPPLEPSEFERVVAHVLKKESDRC